MLYSGDYWSKTLIQAVTESLGGEPMTSNPSLFYNLKLESTVELLRIYFEDYFVRKYMRHLSADLEISKDTRVEANYLYVL